MEHAAVIQLLLNTSHINANAKDKASRTLLIWATQAVDVDSLRILTRGSADVDANNSYSLTALQLAIFNLNLAAEQLLIGYSASVSRDFYGFEALFNKLIL